MWRKIQPCREWWQIPGMQQTMGNCYLAALVDILHSCNKLAVKICHMYYCTVFMLTFHTNSLTHRCVQGQKNENVKVSFFFVNIYLRWLKISFVGAGYIMYRCIIYVNKITSLVTVHCFLLLLASCFVSCEIHTWYIHAVFIVKEIHCASEKCSSETRKPRDIKVYGRGYIMVRESNFSDSQL